MTDTTLAPMKKGERLTAFPAIYCNCFVGPVSAAVTENKVW